VDEHHAVDVEERHEPQEVVALGFHVADLQRVGQQVPGAEPHALGVARGAARERQHELQVGVHALVEEVVLGLGRHVTASTPTR